MNSRRIIVHLIRGEAKEAHEEMTRNLADHLDAFPIHERIVPHLTLKRWFELDEASLEMLHDCLDEFVTTHTQSPYRLHGLNHFGERVIYVDVEPSAEMSIIAKYLLNSLRKINGITFDEQDEIEDGFHATLAMRALKPFDFKET